MARFALLISAVTLWSVCSGYGIFESKDSNEYTDEPTERNDWYTDEYYSEATKVPDPQKYKFRCPSDGLFAYPPDCASFMQCSNGRAHLISCPEGLHFNERFKRCDYPCEAQCDPAIREDCEKEKTADYPSEYTAEPTEDTDLYTNDIYSKATKGPDPQKYKFRCLSDGLFAYPPDCASFIQCSNGRAYLQSCPEGLHFSKRTNRCDYPCEAQCDPAISEYCKEEKDRVCPQIRCKKGCYLDENNKPCPKCVCTPRECPLINCVRGCHLDNQHKPCPRCVCENQQVDEVCSLPRKKGECKAYLVRYYYDASESKCKKFVYGGCNGNGNNFKSEKQCMEVCGRYVAEDTTTQDSSDTYQTEDPWGYGYRLNLQKSTEAPWSSENDASSAERDSWAYPVRSATESTEDDLSPSTDIGPQEPGEDSWGIFTTSESQTTEDSSSWGDDWGRGQESTTLPDEDSNGISFKARVAEDFKCRGNGAYRNSEDCASFIWCPLDRAIVVPCPPNTHYSEQRDECVDPCLAHCNHSLACACGWAECHQYNHFDCESDPDAGPCENRELRYFYDRESGRCKRFYYGGCHGNGNNYRTLKECQRECQASLLAGFRCPSYNGDFGHYPDCVSYYQCKRGIATLKRCPTGMAFHHLKAKCVPEEEAMCVYECREPNAVYPAPKDCRSYINCVNSIPKLEKCPRGMAFDVNKGNCVLERTSSCTW